MIDWIFFLFAFLGLLLLLSETADKDKDDGRCMPGEGGRSWWLGGEARCVVFCHPFLFKTLG